MGEDNQIAAAIDALAPGMRSAERIFGIIREAVESCPEAIQEIIPDSHIVRRKLTTAERVRVAAAGAAERSRKDAEARAAEVMPIIREVLKSDPHASLGVIKKALDESGIKPARAKNWNRATILNILNREGIHRDSDQP